MCARAGGMGLSRKAPVGRGQCGSMALGRPGRREDLLTSAAAARAGSGGASGGRLGARRWGDRRRLAGWMAGWLMVLSDENEPCARGWRLIREEAARSGGCWSGRGRRGGAGRRGRIRDGGGGAEGALEASLLWAGFGGGAGGGGCGLACPARAISPDGPPFYCPGQWGFIQAVSGSGVPGPCGCGAGANVKRLARDTTRRRGARARG